MGSNEALAKYGIARTIEANLGRFLFSRNNLQDYEQCLRAGMEKIIAAIGAVDQPFTGIKPQTLAQRFASLNLDQALGDTGAALDELQQLYLNDAVYFHHPRYVAHLNCPVIYPALLAEQMLTAINSSLDTWDQSAGATLIEQALLDWTADKIGLADKADGIFTSGGSQSNLMGLLLARDHQCERLLPGYSIRQQGLPPIAQKFRIFTSEVSHFSLQKSAALLGLGYQAVVSVPTDESYRLDSKALAQAIDDCRNEGLLPIAVVATTGTTDFGSIDPVNAIADLCVEQGLWLHVDAAYGCGLLLSRRREALSGIERADSISVDYHKSFLQPVSCSAFFARQQKHFDCLTHHADYLNPLSAKQEGTPDLVNKSLQTTRRFDALKLWLSLRIAGPDYIGAVFDRVCDLAHAAFTLIEADSQLDIIHQPQMSTLVFRFLPENFSSCSAEEIDAINSGIRKAINGSGEAMIAATKVRGRRYLKFTLLNPDTTLQDIEHILQLIKQHGLSLQNTNTSNFNHTAAKV